MGLGFNKSLLLPLEFELGVRAEAVGSPVAKVEDDEDEVGNEVVVVGFK